MLPPRLPTPSRGAAVDPEAHSLVARQPDGTFMVGNPPVPCSCQHCRTTRQVSAAADVTPLAPRTPEEGAEFERLLNQSLWGQDEPTWDQLRAAARRNIERTEVRVEVDATPLGELPPEDVDAT